MPEIMPNEMTTKEKVLRILHAVGVDPIVTRDVAEIFDHDTLNEASKKVAEWKKARDKALQISQERQKRLEQQRAQESHFLRGEDEDE